MEGSKGSGAWTPPSSLHEIVLDYITTQALPGTAQALSTARATTVGGSSSNGFSTRANGSKGTNGISNGTSNGTNGHTIAVGGDEDVDMDDEHAGGVASSAKGKKRSTELDQDALESIERRRAILNHILNGAIIRAVDSLNTHFPSVLNPPSPPPPASEASTNGHDTSSSALGLGSASFSLLSRPNIDHSLPVFSHSFHPDHLRLNLQIQQFIESFRQLAPPSNPSSPSSSIGSLASSMHASMHASHSAGTLQHALTAAQGLHQEAKKLPANERAVYLQEIKDVGALFAYTDPETSILKGYLDQERRIALAEQINRAILQSEGRSTQSSLEYLARRTSALWTTMQTRHIDAVPEWTAADGHGKEQLATFAKGLSGKGFKLREFVSQNWG